jgi:hypothetical protein
LVDGGSGIGSVESVATKIGQRRASEDAVFEVQEVGRRMVAWDPLYPTVTSSAVGRIAGLRRPTRWPDGVSGAGICGEKERTRL